MSHPSLPALNQFKNHIKSNNNLILSFDQPSNTDPSTVFSAPTIQLDFEPIHLIKFCLLLLVSLFIPLLSLNSSFLSVLGYRRSHNSHRAGHRHRTSRRKLPVNYEPPKSVVEAPFIPLPTRRHFRLSHVGNRNLKIQTNVVYTNQSSSDSEDNQSEDGSRLDRETTQCFRLIFGKRLRGEEDEFKGRSAMKGSRLLASFQSNSTLAYTDSHPSTQLSISKNSSHAAPIPGKTNAVSTKAISFAPILVYGGATNLTSPQV